MSVIVIEFITMDGIVTDPDGSGGTPSGGWAFRHGPEAIAGDKFRIGGVLDKGVLLLGRKTWELFSRIWPGRDDPFSARMNAVPKLVATRALTDTGAWANSQAVNGDIVDAVKREQRDVIVMGSLSLVHTLMGNDLIDEYRLLTFPTILGAGERLFPAEAPPPTWSSCRLRSLVPRSCHSTGGRHADRPEGGVDRAVRPAEQQNASRDVCLALRRVVAPIRPNYHSRANCLTSARAGDLIAEAAAAQESRGPRDRQTLAIGVDYLPGSRRTGCMASRLAAPTADRLERTPLRRGPTR